MPYPVYSTRLLAAAAGGTWTTYVVPADKVAVVKSVTVANNTTAVNGYLVALNTYWVVMVGQVQAGSTLLSPPLAVVLYPGETLSAHCAADGFTTIISGYELDAEPGRRPPRTLETPGSVDEPPIFEFDVP